jgi:hypothetical protein
MTIHSIKLEVASAIIYVYWLMIFLGLRFFFLIFGFLQHFMWKIPSAFTSTWTSTHKLWMYVTPWLFIVISLKWDQQSSMYTGWWYFWGYQGRFLIFGFLKHFMWKIPSDFTSSWTSTHKLWMYVTPWLFIVKSLRWYQESSMYTGWWNFWGYQGIFWYLGF